MTAPVDDFETWLMSWARQRQDAAYAESWNDRCLHCRHPFHGLPCDVTAAPCPCPTALEEAS